MKIWREYGSEHSYSLVLVGYFTDEIAARSVEQKFDRLRMAAGELPEIGWDADQRFTAGTRELLDELRLWDFARADIENFAYDHSTRRDGSIVKISTDEIEIQGFLKILLGAGARVEIYSAHEWTEDGEPRVEEHEDASEAPDEKDVPASAAAIPVGEAAPTASSPLDGQETELPPGTATEE